MAPSGDEEEVRDSTSSPMKGNLFPHPLKIISILIFTCTTCSFTLLKWSLENPKKTFHAYTGLSETEVRKLLQINYVIDISRL